MTLWQNRRNHTVNQYGEISPKLVRCHHRKADWHRFITWGQSAHAITMASLWGRWRLKSPASLLFTQPFTQRKHQNSASQALVRGIRRWPANSPHKGPVTRKMFSFDDVIMLAVLECNVKTVEIYNFQIINDTRNYQGITKHTKDE